MSKIKILICSVAVFLCILLTGELAGLYIGYVCRELPSVSVTVPAQTNKESWYSALSEAVLRTKTTVIYNKYTPLSDGSFAYCLYWLGDDAEKEVLSRYGISAKTYKSLFAEDTTLKFIPFDELNLDNSANNEYMLLNVINGNPIEFKEALIQTHVFLVKDELISYTGSNVNAILLTAWAVVISLMLLLTVYEIQLTKKEWAVKSVFGENKYKMLIVKLIKDSVAFCVIFAVSYYGLLFLTSAEIFYKTIKNAFIVMLISNITAHIPLMATNLKYAFSNIKVSRKVLAFNYVIKALTGIMTACVLTLCLITIKQAIDFRSQRRFFQSLSDYNYINISVTYPDSPDISYDIPLKALNRSDELRYKLYKSLFTENKVYMQSLYSPKISYDYPDTAVLACNRAAKEYLLNNIKGIKPEQLNDQKVYYLVPEKLSRFGAKNIESTIYNSTDMQASFLQYEYEKELIFYKSAKIITVYDNYAFGKSMYEWDPIIVFSNLDENALALKERNYNVNVYSPDGEIIDTLKTGRIVGSSIDTCNMYSISEQELRDFLSNNEFRLGVDLYSIKNVYEDYLDNMHIITQTLIFNVVVTILLLTLEFMLIFYNIRMRFSANEMEFLLNRIFGYSIWSRYRVLIFIQGIEVVVSIIGCFIAGKLFNIQSIGFLIFLCLILYIAELLISLKYVHKTENVQIQKILKGSIL